MNSHEPKRKKLSVSRERAVLVEVLLDGDAGSADLEPLNELTRLTEAAGGSVVGTLTQRRREIDAGLYVGRGKAEEIRLLAQARKAHVVIFDNDLTPAQIRNLEQAVHVKVLDRSELILDIFATRARTAEARLQVELAQLEYTYPRLRRMWTHLSRIEGGIGTRGPGETQLETDRRLARQRITDLKRRIEQIENRRERQVCSRKGEFTVCLVGYTNAGKSSLLNALTDAEAYVEDQLFATLDTKTRTWTLPFRMKVLLSDTVGFVRKLPHHLVTSFKATLEEALHADLLLHVVDASAPDIDGQVAAVNEVLDEIGCKDQPRLIVLNKIDRLESRDDINVLEYQYPDGVPVSALTGDGLESLHGAVLARLGGQVRDLTIRGPSGDGAWQSTLARHAEAARREFSDGSTIVHTRLPQHLADYLLQEYPELEITLHPLAEDDRGGAGSARRSAS
ncbi:MAG: GTPase HflX [Planctomycetes bacterium]|nr:GTPase HflX [Planctomycetota bacterium]